MIAVAAAGVVVRIGRERIAARDRIKEIHGAVHVDRARGICPSQLSATDRIGGRCQLDLIAASETDPSIVQRFSHAPLSQLGHGSGRRKAAPYIAYA